MESCQSACDSWMYQKPLISPDGKIVREARYEAEYKRDGEEEE